MFCCRSKTQTLDSPVLCRRVRPLPGPLFSHQHSIWLHSSWGSQRILIAARHNSETSHHLDRDNEGVELPRTEKNAYPPVLPRQPAPVLTRRPELLPRTRCQLAPGRGRRCPDRGCRRSTTPKVSQTKRPAICKTDNVGLTGIEKLTRIEGRSQGSAAGSREGGRYIKGFSRGFVRIDQIQGSFCLKM